MSILAILEFTPEKPNRMLETAAAAHQIAATLGTEFEFASIGASHWSITNEGATNEGATNEGAAAKTVKHWSVQHDLLNQYTADGIHGGAGSIDSQDQSHAGAVSSQLSGARLCAQVGDSVWPPVCERCDCGASGERRARFRPPAFSREVE